jgi:hypothetical protein
VVFDHIDQYGETSARRLFSNQLVGQAQRLSGLGNLNLGLHPLGVGMSGVSGVDLAPGGRRAGGGTQERRQASSGEAEALHDVGCPARRPRELLDLRTAIGALGTEQSWELRAWRHAAPAVGGHHPELRAVP